MKKSFFAAAAVAILGMLGSAQAATLGGSFNVTAVNVLNRNSAQSQATNSNFQAALAQAMLGTSGYAYDVFNYTGDLDFKTTNGPSGNASTKISQWLATGVSGAVSGLNATFGALQQSKGSISANSATTTFYLFERLAYLGAGNFSVTHDDGIAVYDDNAYLGGLVGPTTVKTTAVNNFTGGKFSILYVATNSDPSVLKVDADLAPVPLPAAFPLLALGLGGLGLMRARRKAA